jgi:hypothetical protein
MAHTHNVTDGHTDQRCRLHRCCHLSMVALLAPGHTNRFGPVPCSGSNARNAGVFSETYRRIAETSVGSVTPSSFKSRDVALYQTHTHASIGACLISSDRHHNDCDNKATYKDGFDWQAPQRNRVLLDQWFTQQNFRCFEVVDE